MISRLDGVFFFSSLGCGVVAGGPWFFNIKVVFFLSVVGSYSFLFLCI